jgi:hypothetical protein
VDSRAAGRQDGVLAVATRADRSFRPALGQGGAVNRTLVLSQDFGVAHAAQLGNLAVEFHRARELDLVHAAVADPAIRRPGNAASCRFGVHAATLRSHHVSVAGFTSSGLQSGRMRVDFASGMAPDAAHRRVSGRRERLALLFMAGRAIYGCLLRPQQPAGCQHQHQQHRPSAPVTGSSEGNQKAPRLVRSQASHRKRPSKPIP